MATLPAVLRLVEALGRVVELMIMQGSRVVQAALDALPAADVSSLVDELRGRVAECAATTNGSWSVCAAFKATTRPSSSARSPSILSLSPAVRLARRQRILPEAAAHGVDVWS